MKICLVCSDGGHLTEMLQLMGAFDGHETFFITYNVVGGGRNLGKVYKVGILKKNPLRYLLTAARALKILLREMPALVVSTGAEVAIPTLFVARLLGRKIVFIETIARVDQPSTTGKLVYPIANVFLVQWPQLLSHYGGKARYWGRVL